MSIVFRAEDEPVVSRMERLHQLVADSLTPIDVRPALGPAEIYDRFQVEDVGGVRIVGATLSPGIALRTPKLIRRSDPEMCKIDVVVSGGLMCEQDGRQAALRPGDFAFVDFSRPVRWANSLTTVGVAVMFPRALLPLGADDLAQLTGLRFAGDRGSAALVSSLARQLPRRAADHANGAGVRLGTAVLDLLAVALSARLGRTAAVPLDSRRRALLSQVHAFIERRLGDPGLSPAAIAAEHHISVRYLYKLFETQQTAVADWIRHRRLERCRRDLLDPALHEIPVSAIAARWGLTNPAHFSRIFRTAYDVPPAEYRLTRGWTRANHTPRPALTTPARADHPARANHPGPRWPGRLTHPP